MPRAPQTRAQGQLTTQNRIFLLSFISLVWALIIWLILESDTVIFGDNTQSIDDSIEVSSGMLFQGMSQDD